MNGERLESKEEYKKRTGRHSPDSADACILCFYNRDNVMSVAGSLRRSGTFDKIANCAIMSVFDVT